MEAPHVVATCLGVDPGTTYHAMAFLEAMSDGMIWPRQLLYAEYSRSTVGSLYLALRPRPATLTGPAVPHGVVALETIMGGLYGNAAARRSRFGGVAETKGSERLFRVLANEMGVPHVDRAASHGRKIIIGSGTASDAQIRLAIEGLYTTNVPGDDLPKIALAKHRPHIYDAVVVGMCELYERMAGVDDEGQPTKAGPLVVPHLVKQIRTLLRCPGCFLPARLRQAVAQVRGQEKADRDEAKMRVKLGLPVAKKERRTPTRATAEVGKAKAAATRRRNKGI